MKNFSTKLIAFVLFTSAKALSQPIYNVDEKEFRLIVSEIVKIYSPIFDKKGVDFWMEPNWQSNDVHLYAKKFDDLSWKIVVSGGFARQSEISNEGLILAICHQIGHLMSGKLSDYSTEEKSWQYAYDVCSEKIFLEWSKRYNLKKLGVKIDECEKLKTNSDVCYYKAFAKKSIEFLNERLCYGPQRTGQTGH